MPVPGGVGRYMQFRGVHYAEVDGSPEGNLYFDKGMITRRFHVAYENLDDVIAAFTGSVAIAVGGTDLDDETKLVRTLTRTIPHSMPRRSKMFVQGISNITNMKQCEIINWPESANIAPVIEGHIDGNQFDGTGTARYWMCEIGLQYVMPSFKIKADSEVTIVTGPDPLLGLPDEGTAIAYGYPFSRYITRHIKHMGKMLTIPRGLLKGSDGKLILEAIAIQENVAMFEYTWHQVPEAAIPELTWIAAQGTVNDAVFDGRPAGTLLFAGDPEVRMDPNPLTEEYMATIKYQFHSLCIPDDTVTPPVVRGHNYVRKVIDNKIKPVEFSSDGVGVATGSRVFKSFDFRRLFRPDPIAAP